jgi:hypothetical protein
VKSDTAWHAIYHVAANIGSRGSHGRDKTFGAEVNLHVKPLLSPEILYFRGETLSAFIRAVV